MDTIILPWKDDYSVKIQEIDDQHKILINIINDLYNAFIRKEHEQQIEDTISKLCEYATIHFSIEEKYFSQFNYSEASEHIKEHKDFVEKINSLKKDLIQKKSLVTYSLINFLKNWLTNHILVSDKKYTNCFIENGLQ